MKACCVPVALLVLGGCVSVPPDAGFPQVSADAKAVTRSAPLAAGHGAEAAQPVDDLLAHDLTPDTAMQIAVLQSPRIRKAIEQLGVARADFEAAVLPPNPILEAAKLDPRDHTPAYLEYGLSIRLFDLLFSAHRAKMAQAEFDAAQAETSAEVIKTAIEAHAALTDYIAARQTADFYRQAETSARAAAMAASALFDAGNTAQVERDRNRLFSSQATAARFEAEADLGPARERVNVLLGLSGERARVWTTAATLPEPPTTAIDPAEAEAQAAAVNPMLKAAQAQLKAVQVRTGISDLQSILGDAELAGRSERENGVWRNGVGGSIPVPIFGLGSPVRHRARAEAAAAAETLRAVQIEVRAGARGQAQRLESLRQLAIYRRQTMLPLARDVYSGSVLDFNGMQIGVFAILEAKRQQLEVGRDYIRSLRDYWVARGELEAMGAVKPVAGE